MVYIHNGIYSAIKENEIMLFEATWMDQEIVILWSQTLELGLLVCRVTNTQALTLPLGFPLESLPTPTWSLGPLAVSPTYQHCFTVQP